MLFALLSLSANNIQRIHVQHTSNTRRSYYTRCTGMPKYSCAGSALRCSYQGTYVPSVRPLEHSSIVACFAILKKHHDRVFARLEQLKITVLVHRRVSRQLTAIPFLLLRLTL